MLELESSGSRVTFYAKYKKLILVLSPLYSKRHWQKMFLIESSIHQIFEKHRCLQNGVRTEQLFFMLKWIICCQMVLTVSIFLISLKKNQLIPNCKNPNKKNIFQINDIKKELKCMATLICDAVFLFHKFFIFDSTNY